MSLRRRVAVRSKNTIRIFGRGNIVTVCEYFAATAKRHGSVTKLVYAFKEGMWEWEVKRSDISA